MSGDRTPLQSAQLALTVQGISPQGPGKPGQRRWITPCAVEVVRDRPGKEGGEPS